MKIQNEKTIIMSLLIVVFFFTIIIPVQSAFAVPVVTWDSPTHTLNDGSAGGTPVLVTVTDAASNVNSAQVDQIVIRLISTSDPVGISLTLSEEDAGTAGVPDPNSGVFRNTNLIFMKTNSLLPLGTSETITITDGSANMSSTTIEHLTVSGGSTSQINIADPGVMFDLVETGQNTGVFTGTLLFTSGSSHDNVLHEEAGDIVTIADTNSFLVTNQLVSPNPNPRVGAITANILDVVTATFQGQSDTTTIVNDESPPGGGGGGIIHPGFVLDIIRAVIGGSPFVVSPPSFGGGGGNVTLHRRSYNYTKQHKKNS